MDIEMVREVCLQFPQVTEEIKWEKNLCFLIHEKIFLVVSLDEVPTKISFKVPKEAFFEITSQDHYQQAAYFAKGQWVSMDDIALLEKEFFVQYCQRSFELVKAKLPKKIQATF